MFVESSTAELQVRDLVDLYPANAAHASIVFIGADEPEVVHLSARDDPVFVGRLEPSNVCIQGPGLSRQHACFRWANGRLTVEDLNSRNGTWVGGKKIRTATLHSGDELMLGGVRAVVGIMRRGSRIRPSKTETIPGAEDLVVLNSKMRDTYQMVSEVASYNAPVLVLGETGTGKEHVAHALHAMGNRRNKPFKVINCGGMPPGLVESTLFGHEKGAFTGAHGRAPGLFEQANGGVLFFDEVGELSLEAQASMLRVVETQRITRIGSSKEIAVDVRIVGATHCNIEAMAQAGTFRRDLMYRLNTITIELPPLRERRDEIAPLAELFAKRAFESCSRSSPEIAPAVIEALERYDWPGNIRQLRNVLERCPLLCDQNRIEPNHLPHFLRSPKAVVPSPEPPACSQSQGSAHFGTDACAPAPGAAAEAASGAADPTMSWSDQLRQLEIDLICQALQRTGGNQSAAARLLRMPRRTLTHKLTAFGLRDATRLSDSD